MLRWTEKKEGREEGGLSTLSRYFKCLLKTQIFPALTDTVVCEKEVRLNGISLVSSCWRCSVDATNGFTLKRADSEVEVWFIRTACKLEGSKTFTTQQIVAYHNATVMVGEGVFL